MISSNIKQKLPSHVDETVAEYLVQILSDESSYDNVDELVSTIQPFLEDDETLARSIVEAVVSTSHSKRSAAPSTTRWPESTLESVPAIVKKPNHPVEVVSDESDSTGSSSKEGSADKARKQRKERRQRKKKGQKKIKAPSTAPVPDLLEDEASAWKECQEQGIRWGGRGRGGRGEYAGAVNSVKSNIHLSNVSVSLDNGLDLLSQSTMDIVRGHRYGLLGRNGVGKSTLMRRLAQKAVPGMPQDMRILLVQQQIEGTGESSLSVLLDADVNRKFLLAEQESLEQRLEVEGVSTEELEKIAERLGDIVGDLEAIGADTAEDRAVEILKGLQFTETMINGPTAKLSGGWRMRLALARALFVPSDLLLLDEPSNHLDLFGLDWLINYINRDPERTVIVVSHDRTFLDAVCTDMVVLEHQRLDYHVGNYSEYERQMQEKASREAQILDAAERQQKKAQDFIQKQQALANKKSADPKKQRQAKMIKEKKLERFGNYREDGKRYKQFSLATLSEDSIRLAQKVNIEADAPVARMYFPNPAWPSGIAPGDALVRFEDFFFSYDGARPLLTNVMLVVARGSKIAIVGRNGAGKSTLVNLISGEIDPKRFQSRGSLWRHPNLRIGHITQYAVEELERYADQTVVDYAEERLRSGKASAKVVAKASGNVRQYLGSFGLGGRHALQQIGQLSGGERMRLCFATVLAEEPNVLLLDESTNHVDRETLDVMSEALDAYEGTVIMVSHNQGFLSGFCKELWVVEKGQVTVNHSEAESFDELFASYRSSALNSGKSLSDQRRAKADMAKRAAKQRTEAPRHAVLL